MTIDFGDSDCVEVPDSGAVAGSEFAQLSVRFDVDANAPRLRLEDLRSGRVRYLHARELETLVWLPDERLSGLLDPVAPPRQRLCDGSGS